MKPGSLAVTGDSAKDALLNESGTALLIAMLLDQQIPIEWAFTGPATLQARLGHLDAVRIADSPLAELVEACCRKPAVHRFPAVMAKRIHELCHKLSTDYIGRGELVWSDITSGEELYQRLRGLPGFGEEKARIFVALLAKRFDVQPPGWQDAAGKFSDDEPRSVADITGPEAFAAVRRWKKAQKLAGKDKQDRPLPGSSR